jgi:hypothetical protein
VIDINVFVRPSQRNAEREAVGLARIRQQVKAGKLKINWMSEEEKAAYRLREPPETGAIAASVRRARPSIPLHGVAWRAPIVHRYHVGCDTVAGATLGIVWLATRTRALVLRAAVRRR